MVKQSNGVIASKVYELPQPKKYIHSWNEPTLFDQINPDSLITRVGCAVLLKKNGTDSYSGSTKDKECKSTLRGASYATSKVEIFKDRIVSWDQGWDSNDQQVWGAETRGYIFMKKNE